jgi:hypothetical protein
MLPEYSWRAKKETTTKGLKRANNHHNSFILSDIVPLQVEWTRTHHDDPMFVFTAKSELEENDTAGKGKLVNRIIKYHARVPNSGITVLHEHYELYHALQNIFLVDVDQFAAYQKATR